MDKAKGRIPVSRDRALRCAVDLADTDGIAAVSMRHVADRLGVVPMALYKHVTDKGDLLDGMFDVAIADVDVPELTQPWREAARSAVLSARRVYLAHPWLREIIETRGPRTAAALAYLDALTGTFLAGGLSANLTHYAMHALGHRVWGFSPDGVRGLGQDNGTGPDADPAQWASIVRQMARQYPNIATVTFGAPVDPDTLTDAAAAVPARCDEQHEFEFTLDLLLEAFARLHEQGWTGPRD